MIDCRGRLIYVGKAKNLRTRLLSYFRESSRDPKAGKIIQHTRVLVWEQTGDEFAALLRELELIQTLRPRFNVLGVPGLQRHHYLCVGKSPAPYVYITNTPTGKELGVYGPLVSRGQLGGCRPPTQRLVQLRDCPQTVLLAFADQRELFPEDRSPKCLRFELGTCRGPCVAACSRKEYGAGVRGAKAFLDGRDRTILAKLKEMMEAAGGVVRVREGDGTPRSAAVSGMDRRPALAPAAGPRPEFVRLSARRATMDGCGGT